MNNIASSPFHRFQGWRFLALFIVFALYTSWYVGPGFFGDMLRIPGHISLQEKGFYTGVEAVDILGRLDEQGRKAKFLALIFDVPYMFLQALLFEACIAFGLRHMRPKNPKWNLLFILPIGFLLTDFAEDSLIALTLTTGSMALGSTAGVMTALKFTTFIPGIIVSLIMLGGGLWAWFRKKKRIKTQ